jgi:hypothetical protein
MAARIGFLLLIVLGLPSGSVFGAIPDPEVRSGTRVRVLADARAVEPAPITRPLQSPVGQTESLEVLRREVVQQGDLVSARFDDFDARLYEIVGRLQLLTLCLFALFLGIFVWQLSIAREIARLKAAERTTDVG